MTAPTTVPLTVWENDAGEVACAQHAGYAFHAALEQAQGRIEFPSVVHTSYPETWRRRRHARCETCGRHE
jgi:hypothetical protein